MKTIIITGSRDYKDWKLVFAALEEEYKLALGIDNLLVKFGDCPTGADLFAWQWCVAKGAVMFQRFEADWPKYGKAAGPIRNHRMVSGGADLVLAFPLESSKGTVDCAVFAFSEGVKVRFPEMERDKGKYPSFTEPSWYKWAAKLSGKQE